MFGRKKPKSDKTVISVKAYANGVQEITVEAQTIMKAYALWRQLTSDLKLINNSDANKN